MYASLNHGILQENAAARFTHAAEILRHFQTCNMFEAQSHTQTRDAFREAKILNKGFQKVFNVWTKSHFNNFEVV